MTNQDWEKFGERIQKTVQEAVDSHNFQELNETITRTVNSAVENITGARQNEVKLYRKVGGYKVAGWMLLGFGIGFGGILMVVLGLVTAGMLILEGISFASVIGAVFFAMVIGSCCTVSVAGGRMIGKTNRFQTYTRVIGPREYCNVSELSGRTNRKVKAVRKDLEWMIRKRWFLQGHLDDQKTCLLVTHSMYEQYRRLQAQRRARELEDENRRRREDAARQQQEQQAEQERREHEQLPPQVRTVMEQGNVYIRKIRACNDAIPGEEISEKIFRIEMVVTRIFERVKQQPGAVDDIHRLMDYYLPTTVKLLEAYQDLDGQPADGENIRSSKREIEETLDTLNVAFEKLLDDMFQNTAWDVSSDISVLNTILSQEGLVKDGMKTS